MEAEPVDLRLNEAAPDEFDAIWAQYMAAIEIRDREAQKAWAAAWHRYQHRVEMLRRRLAKTAARP